MKIFLSWWWDNIQSKSLDDIYKSTLCWKNILYIPWAFWPDSYDACLDWIVNIFPINEWYKMYLLKETDSFDEEFILKFDSIFIWWWNTYRLLKLFKTTWFDKILKKFINSWKAVYGWSAWALILTKEITTCKDFNSAWLDLSETFWYNYFNDCSIFPHYRDRFDIEINDYVSNFWYNVIAIEEWAWVFLDNWRFFKHWDWKVYIFDWDWKKEINWEFLI